jgi:hypothetical protein
MWFFVLCGGLILIAFVGVCLEACRLRFNNRPNNQPSNRPFTGNCRRKA